mmetsp:Transcript_33759/g.77935  ORF Transcript_33759/g.77935 Transcript_33759/m.77935 type:complete len:183 (+) Transcript_33759:294-842(+)
MLPKLRTVEIYLKWAILAQSSCSNDMEARMEKQKICLFPPLQSQIQLFQFTRNFSKENTNPFPPFLFPAPLHLFSMSHIVPEILSASNPSIPSCPVSPPRHTLSHHSPSPPYANRYLLHKKINAYIKPKGHTLTKNRVYTRVREFSVKMTQDLLPLLKIIFHFLQILQFFCWHFLYVDSFQP